LSDADVIVRANAIDRYAKAKTADIALIQSAEERARKDSMNDARLSAIAALGEINYPQREAFARSLLTDRDPVVRRVAADLLEEKLKKNRPQFTPLAVDRPAPEYEDIVASSHAPHTATIHMPRGNIEMTLLVQDAPITTWNFAQLAKRKYFDNTSF